MIDEVRKCQSEVGTMFKTRGTECYSPSSLLFSSHLHLCNIHGSILMRLLSPSSTKRSSLLLLSSTLLLTRPFTASASALSHMTSPPSTLPEQSPFSAFSKTLQEQLGKQGFNLNEQTQPEMTPQTEQRIADAQALFQSKVTLDIIKRSWSPTGVFEDPIAYTKGYRQYAAQWWGMKVFNKSETLAWRLVSSSPTEILYAQKHIYAKFGMEKVMHSTVWMKLDDTGRIAHFQDRWDGKDMPGWWAWGFRRLNALTLPLFMSVPSKVHPDMAEGNGPKGRSEL